MDVTPKAFNAIHKINITELENLTNEEIRPLLPCLARIALRYKFEIEVSPVTESDRNKILYIIQKHEDINSIISLLSYDFQALEVDLTEQRSFGRAHRSLNDIKTSINENTIISLDFSRNENFCRHRLIINELLQMQQLNMLISTAQLKETFYKSELFELDVYINEISDVICCAMMELPNTLRLLDVIESLLYVKMGPRLICRIAANFSEHFDEICLSLISNSKQSENEESLIGKIRTNVLRSLCKMNPSCVSVVRSAAIEMSKMPALCLHLSLDHMEIFQDNEKNKSAKYIYDLLQFVRDILLSNENEAKSWLKDGQKKIDLLSFNDQNKNEKIYEPVYSLACQVYNRMNDLFDLSDDRIESNKELILMIAHVFTLFNTTLSEKLKIQHAMEEYKEGYEQQKFLNTREKENYNSLKEKLEEYETQNHEDIQKYESEINQLECKIKNLEKDKRKFEYEIEDNLKELKHIHDSITNLLNLIDEYGNSEDYGINQFFKVFHTFMMNVDLKQQTLDKTKLLNQLNNHLDKKLIDVKNEVLRIQEENIYIKLKNGENRINQMFENGTGNFIKNEFVFEPIYDDKLAYSNNLNNNHNHNHNYYDEQETYEFEDDLTDRIKQLKIINQSNLDKLKNVEQQIQQQCSDNQSNMKEVTNEEINSKELIDTEELENLIYDNLIDEIVQEEIKNKLNQLKEENKCKLKDILNTGLVKVNSNNEIVTTNKTNSNLSQGLSQAKLMLINEQNYANEEDIYNRFEKSLAEIITNSVNQSELSSPEEGETLQSILDSKHNSLNDNINEEQRKQINHNKQQEQNDETKEIDCKIIELLEEIVKYDNFNEIIDKDKLMQKSICSPKKYQQNKLLTPEKKKLLLNGNHTNQIERKDVFINTNLIELKENLTLTDNLNTKTVSTETEIIEMSNVEVNTNLFKNVSISTDKLRTKNKSCSSKDLITRNDIQLECDLKIETKDCSTTTDDFINKKSIELNCDLIKYNDQSFNTEEINKENNNNDEINKINLDKVTLSQSSQTKTFYRILTRSSRFIKLKKRFIKLPKNKTIKKNDQLNQQPQQNGKCIDQTLIYSNNNNYLNDIKSNGKNHNNQLLNNNLKNHHQQDVDYDFVFCNHVPPIVNFLIAFIILIIGFLFKMIKSFILLIVFIFFSLHILFYFFPVPSYLSWQDILVNFLEPHISVVHHFPQSKV